MPFDPKRLRKWFAIAAVLLMAVVIGFYSYARYRINQVIKKIPPGITTDIDKASDDFTITVSAGGDKQFSISAKKAVQYKGGQHVGLKNVRIIVYGQGALPRSDSDRYDQIYGKEFEYDSKAGEVRASGEVMIDLARHGTPSKDPQSEEPQPGSLHLKTSGLVFNQKTGIAQTDEPIEFSIPQASGSAVGAVYASANRTLTLQSHVRLQASPENARRSTIKMNGATITAHHAVITDVPTKIDLAAVHVEQQARAFDADRLQIFLRENNTIERALATGNVQAADRSSTGDRSTIRAAQAAFAFGNANALRDVLLTGDVALDITGKQPTHATAGKVLVDFSGRNRVEKVHATEKVAFEQNADRQTSAIQAEGIDFFLAPNGGLTRATTAGASQIVIKQATGSAPAPTTTLTADAFEARFGAKNRISSVHGENNAKIVFSGREARTATSREITATFNTTSARNGELQSVEQIGDFKYTEGNRTASSDRARYLLADDSITLLGSPRIQDKHAGFAATANTIRLNRRTGEASGDGDVKTTYTEMKPANGAMLAGSDPIHVTSAAASASSGGQALFTGKARLWQGANIVQGPVIAFDRTRRWLQASSPGNDAAKVSTAFAQTDKGGKTTPVNVHADKLTYSDIDRRARFEGGVTVSTIDATITASQVDILLRPRGQNAGPAAGPSQLEQIVATGNLVIEQQDPVRRAAGDRLVYTASDGKFVLTGSEAKSPSIFDAERGEIAGDSLTFFSRDGRVQVGSGVNSRTVTRTRIKDETRP